MNLKSFIASRSIGFYIILGAVAAEVISMILYASTGVTEFSPELSAVPFITESIALALGVVSLFFEHKIVREISYLLALYGFISYVGTQANYLANIFTAIDGSTFSAGFILTVIFFLLAFVASLVSVFFSGHSEKDEVKIVAAENNGGASNE